MTKAQMKEIAKKEIFGAVSSALDAKGGKMVDDFEIVCPTVVDGQEIFVSCKLTAKTWYATKQSEPYDLDDEIAEYEFKKAQREKSAKEKEEKKKKLAESKKSKK